MRRLIIQNVCKVFTGENNRQVEALRDVSFVADPGSFISIIGPTGCGKTTLLRLIAGLDTATSGRIMLDDQHIEGINRACTLVFQQFSLFPWYSVLGNVTFALEMRGIDKIERQRQALELLKLVRLEDVAKARPYELSGGMQQRVAIARALAYNPEILLMDEPFGALDEKTRHKLQNALIEIWRDKRKTILFVTHNIDEAIYLADRILVMTAEPGHITDDIAIDLPRPRNRISSEFTELHIRVRNRLEILD